MADASDSKSDVRKYVWVQVPPPVPNNLTKRDNCGQSKEMGWPQLLCAYHNKSVHEIHSKGE